MSLRIAMDYTLEGLFRLQEECNVVCVDWEGGASMPNYLRAAANTRLVGKQLAMLLQGNASTMVHLVK